ncbi:MAG TPA: cupin-like domain-containing protein [Leptolyngbyaceae cyanobacterium M33_DOE_097]|nr:cupin-like domain-containing protein [Leptolyngbyaceae cyanobacterium M33_DOE_097]
MHTLKSLLAPYDRDLFLTHNWTQQAVAITSDRVRRFESLFTWDDLNQLLTFHQIPHPDLRFSLDGRTLTQTESENWLECLRQGATLVINSVRERVPSLAKVAAELRYELGHRTQINLYCSPANQQGFECHYDTHEVLILQIDGQKEWCVFDQTVPFPVAETRSPDDLPPDTAPYLTCILKPGDVLYIPRGHWHYAVSCDRPSLHLTIGIDSPTRLDWLEWLVNELHDDPAWRVSLPLLRKGDTQAAQQQVDELRQQLISALQNPELTQKYVQQLQVSELPKVPANLPAQLGFDIFKQGFATRFYRIPTLPIQFQNEGDRYQITLGSKQVTLRGVPLEFVKNLMTQSSFGLLDLADWAPDLDFDLDVVPLLTQLVEAGVLLVEGDNQAAEQIWLNADANHHH